LPRAYASVATVIAASTVVLAASRWLEPRAAPLAPGEVALRIDPNRASAAELELLPRIGPALARAIIEHREHAATQPAFRTLADLDAIRGIGPVALAELAPHIALPADEP
jgi:competence protein ComEA